MYVRKDPIRDLQPTIAGRSGNARMFAFNPKEFAYHETARRFELGTTANAAVYAASASLDIIHEIGVERIRDRTTELVSDLIGRLQDAHLAIRTPEAPEARAEIVMVPADDPASIVRALGHRGIIVDYRHDRIRASPYFYNTPEDNERFVEALRAALKKS